MKGWNKKRKVKKRYDLTADMYDARYAEEQKAKYYAALANFEPKGLALDLGCGSGLFLDQLSLKTSEVVGIDISKGLLLRARERARKLANVTLIQADADNLPFEDGKFEVIYSFTVLQNMPNPRTTLLEARRTARDDSMLVVAGLKRVFSKTTLKKLLRHAGLQEISIENIENLKCYIVLAKKIGQNLPFPAPIYKQVWSESNI